MSIASRPLNARRDAIDLRDAVYRPALLDLPVTFFPSVPALNPKTGMPVAGSSTLPAIRDQVLDGPCTGYALANVVDMQAIHRVRNSVGVPQVPPPVSARMLYEMARSHDEFEDADGPGSSVRGAIKGFYHHGVCLDDPDLDSAAASDWILTVERAKQARNIGIGAYYRLLPAINDYHAAIAEVGAIFVSAVVHDGWSAPKSARDGAGRRLQSSLEIDWSPKKVARGGHAFAIVGFDELGFIVLNSWGYGWGKFRGQPGLARWTYEDWSENVMDAWVLRLAAPTPRAFDLTVGLHGFANRQTSQTKRVGTTVPRREVLGHYLNVDDGKLVTQGAYPTTPESIAETASFLTSSEGKSKYQHLMLYAHGGLNTVGDAIGQVAAMKEVWKRNGIYPMHFIWNTGAFSEAADVIEGLFKRSTARVGGIFSDATDLVVEKTTARFGRALWREMKQGASEAFDVAKPGRGEALAPIVDLISKATLAGMNIHVVGHSAGAILLGELVTRLTKQAADASSSVATVSLMAPACTLDFYRRHWDPVADRLGISFATYVLNDKLEKGDTVGPYQKSILYLVSRAFEEAPETPILGMVDYLIRESGGASSLGSTSRFVSKGPLKGAPTTATTHGGFDDDVTTLNHIMSRITGKAIGVQTGFRLARP